MKKLFVFAALAVMAISTLAADQEVKGTLVDVACGTANGQKDGFGAKHTKKCLQMAQCEKSGYAVLTADKKLIKFDAAGNDSAKKFIADSSKDSDIQVTVSGSVNGDTMSVSKIELQK